MSCKGIGFLSVLAALALAGCSSTQDVLQPTAPDIAAASTPTSPTPAGPAADQPAAGQAVVASPGSSQAPAIADPARVARARIQIAPIVGTSVEAATALSERLALRARERAIGLTGSGDAATTHVLKGYFTPLTEGKQTTVIFVWDVYDPAGTRVHRISGQQKVASSVGEGWSAVTSETMRQIADATIDQFAQWVASTPG